MASAAVRSKAVVLLLYRLFIVYCSSRCLCFCVFGPCFAMQYLVSFISLFRQGCFFFIIEPVHEISTNVTF